MSASGMPQRKDATEIELTAHGNQAKMIGAPRDVLQRSGPAAAGVSNPPVFETPRGQSSVCECRAEMTDIFQVVFRPPESAVDHDHDRMQSFFLRNTKIPKLQRVRSIGDSFHRLVSPTQEEFAEQSRTFGLAYTGKYIDMMVQPRVCQNVIDGSGRAGLRIGRSEDEACNSSMDHRARAHDAGFDRAVHRDSGEPVIAE